MLGNVTITFRRPRISPDFLIWGVNGLGALRELLKNENYEELNARSEFYWLGLIKAALTPGFWDNPVLVYSKVMIEEINPRMVVSGADNNETLHELASAVTPPVVAFQNSRRFESRDLFQNKVIQSGVRTIFVFSDAIAARYSAAFASQTNVVVYGSLRNSMARKPNDIHLPKNTLLFISEFHPQILRGPEEIEDFTAQGEPVTVDRYYGVDRECLISSAKFAIENEMNFAVAGREYSHNGDEFNWFHRTLGGSKFLYFPKQDWDSSYGLLEQAELVVTVDSTLGYEALSRGVKTAFFSARGSEMSGYKSFDFGWPHPFGKSGLNWTNRRDIREFLDCLHRLLNYPEALWYETLAEVLPHIIEKPKSRVETLRLLRDILSERNN